MIHKKYDWVGIGHNLPSLLLGLQILEQNKSALIIDDGRMAYGPLTEEFFPAAAAYVYQQKFNQFKISKSDLLDTEYFRPCPYVLSLDRKLIRLGNNPRFNFHEILRKCPFVFDLDLHGSEDQNHNSIKNTGNSSLPKDFSALFPEEGIDFALWQVCREISDQLVDVPYGGRRIENLLEISPLWLKHLYLAFEQNYYHIVNSAYSGDKQAWQKLIFYYASNSFHHKKIALPSGQFELFSLLIHLLSPHYKLNLSFALKELQNQFFAHGGHYNKSSITHFDIGSLESSAGPVQDDLLRSYSKIDSIELSSVDGFLKADEIAWVGGPVSVYPFRQGIRQFCQFLDFKFDSGHRFHNDLVIYGKGEWLGQNIPLIFSTTNSQGATTFHLPIQVLPGQKESFYRPEIIKAIDQLVTWPKKSIQIELENLGILKPHYWPHYKLEEVFNFIQSKGHLPNRRELLQKTVLGTMNKRNVLKAFKKKIGPMTMYGGDVVKGHCVFYDLQSRGSLGQISLFGQLSQ